MATLRIVLAQLNLMVGDIDGNLQKHLQAATKARDELAADVIIFPELSLTGYPPEDLLLRHQFIETAEKALQKFITEIKNIYCFVSHPQQIGDHLYNTCSLVYNGEILGTYAKKQLPNYGVFDEKRYFKRGKESCVVSIKNIPVGIVICEDLWVKEPIASAASLGARLILSPNASPFETNKHERRAEVLKTRATENKLPIAYVNMVGGQDELVFDGGSMVVNAEGIIAQFAGFFAENLLPVDIEFKESSTQIQSSPFNLADKHQRIYQALVLSLRDYIEKNKLPGVLIGVSGGIDSALTLALACDALGNDKVEAILMPSRYTAEISMADALSLINQLKVKYEIISIEPSYQAFLQTLEPIFAGKKPDVTEENMQARCRAVILMALSNKNGKLVLTTGNRSELAVGYCTLYGDMAGGFAVLKDVPKTLVYELASYRNQLQPVIPQRIIDRPPTAELAPNQKDEDVLPPYPVLDKILDAYLNHGHSITEIVEQGFDHALVTKIVGFIRKSEYKRRQAAIGPRINHKSFGRDWRYPVTNGFRG